MIAGAQYQNNCNNVVISNLVDLAGITPQKGLTTQWLSTVCQFYRGNFSFLLHIISFLYLNTVHNIVLANTLCEETFVQTCGEF